MNEWILNLICNKWNIYLFISSRMTHFMHPTQLFEGFLTLEYPVAHSKSTSNCNENISIHSHHYHHDKEIRKSINKVINSQSNSHINWAIIRGWTRPNYKEMSSYLTLMNSWISNYFFDLIYRYQSFTKVIPMCKKQ